jgi:predicted component of type VI protein secretion system
MAQLFWLIKKFFGRQLCGRLKIYFRRQKATKFVFGRQLSGRLKIGFGRQIN